MTDAATLYLGNYPLDLLHLFLLLLNLTLVVVVGDAFVFRGAD